MVGDSRIRFRERYSPEGRGLVPIVVKAAKSRVEMEIMQKAWRGGMRNDRARIGPRDVKWEFM